MRRVKCLYGIDAAQAVLPAGGETSTLLPEGSLCGEMSLAPLGVGLSWGSQSWLRAGFQPTSFEAGENIGELRA
jgi:hypothetical protein